MLGNTPNRNIGFLHQMKPLHLDAKGLWKPRQSFILAGFTLSLPCSAPCETEQTTIHTGCNPALPRNCVDHPAACNLFKTTIQALALQPAVWEISCLVLLPSPCNDSACTYHSAIFVKPQQWPTSSESIAIYCVRKLVSCVTHLQSCAKVPMPNGRCDLGSLNSVVAVFSGGVTIVKKFCNLQFL